jgi:hypothetical protein
MIRFTSANRCKDHTCVACLASLLLFVVSVVLFVVLVIFDFLYHKEQVFGDAQSASANGTYSRCTSTGSIWSFSSAVIVKIC